MRHGTDAGYQAHRKAGEDACVACRAAHTAYQAELRAAMRALPCAVRARPAPPGGAGRDHRGVGAVTAILPTLPGYVDGVVGHCECERQGTYHPTPRRRQ